MKLKNNVTVKDSVKPILLSYTFLGTIIISLLALLYFNFRSSITLATDNPSNLTTNKAKITANDFRILQNGVPIIPVMGVAINSPGIFEIQVKVGVDLKKIKTKPIGAEISILRSGTKADSVQFEDVKDLKSNDLQSWINSNYQKGDKISIGLLNTVLEEDQAVKVYSLASVY